ncbi:MAG: alpha/beta hydrolase [Bacteroidota bacterium]
MKKYYILIIALLFAALCLNVFGQTKPLPFEVKKSGQGKQSIVFIPGFASSGQVWDETKAVFEKNYTCYTFTMAGFADVKPLVNQPTFKAWETAIANYIKDNKIEKPIIIGHSMGGGLALAIAADYPQLIQKIVVVDALPCLSALMNPSFKAKSNNNCSETVQQITSMNDEQFKQMQKMTIPRLLADTMKHDLVVNWSMQSDRKTFAEMFCDFSNTDLRESIKNIQCPSLILLEANFKGIHTSIEEQYRNLKTAQLQYANKGLHFIMYDDKEWYFTQLNNFLSPQ